MTRAVSRPGLLQTEITVKADSVRSSVCAQRGGVAVLGIRDLLNEPQYTVLVELRKGVPTTRNKNEKSDGLLRRRKKAEPPVQERTAVNFIVGGKTEEELTTIVDGIEQYGGPDFLKVLVGKADVVRIIIEVRSVIRQVAETLERIREEDKHTREVPVEELKRHRNVCGGKPDITVKLD
jgi:hypothetical protein